MFLIAGYSSVINPMLSALFSKIGLRPIICRINAALYAFLSAPLSFPAIKNIKRPSSLIDYLENYGGNVTDNDWHDFLKLSLDYVFRVGNHIQPLIDGERKYVRDSNIGTPIKLTA